jgi:HEAT repeat protein
VLPRFGEPEFISRAVEAFDRWSRTRGREAAGFLLAIGPATVPGLMDLFLADESAGGRRIVFDLLCNFGQASVNEALKRLRDPRPHAVRNILILIRWAGSAAVVPAVRPLLQHQDQKVRREALSVLLRFKDPGAAEVLRQELRSKDPDIASQAVSLAGQYRVSAVVDDLLPLFKRVIILEADYATNEEIIRALGEIGDPRAVPDLEKMVKTSWSLYPASLARVKQTIFGSLGRYPRESIAGLLKIGERSTDESIRRVCRKLAERG